MGKAGNNCSEFKTSTKSAKSTKVEIGGTTSANHSKGGKIFKDSTSAKAGKTAHEVDEMIFKDDVNEDMGYFSDMSRPSAKSIKSSGRNGSSKSDKGR